MPYMTGFVIAGLGMFAFGGWTLARAWHLRRHGVSVEGRVVRITADEGGGFPVVQFSAQGATHQFTSRSSVGVFSRLQPGQSVPVRYSTAKPANAIIDTPRHAFKRPSGLIALGFFLATYRYVPYFELLP